jgi:hypothetical protein
MGISRILRDRCHAPNSSAHIYVLLGLEPNSDVSISHDEGCLDAPGSLSVNSFRRQD